MTEWVEEPNFEEIRAQRAQNWSTRFDWYACSIAPQKTYCSSCIIKRLKAETPGLSKRQYNKIEKQIAKDYQLMLAKSDSHSKV